jgi:hypothetical protein
MSQEGCFQRQATGKASQLAVAGYDPVAGDKDKDRVPTTGLTNGPIRPGAADPRSDFSVGGNPAQGDFLQSEPDLHLKGAAVQVQGMAGVFRFPREIALQGMPG